MSTLIRVFVYGSLKPGQANHYVCERYVVDAHPAIANGHLFHLPFGYPAMTSGGTGLVSGYLLTFTDRSILSILDDFEQHDPEEFWRYVPGQRLEANQYFRRELPIFTPERSPLESAWSYVMEPQQIQRLGGIAIPDGNWQGQT
jgi:gamma-glutamylcyclotransferase (GGCT)/AIG2-like uncharacterized protein YtfP